MPSGGGISLVFALIPSALRRHPASPYTPAREGSKGVIGRMGLSNSLQLSDLAPVPVLNPGAFAGMFRYVGAD